MAALLVVAPPLVAVEAPPVVPVAPPVVEVVGGDDGQIDWKLGKAQSSSWATFITVLNQRAN